MVVENLNQITRNQLMEAFKESIHLLLDVSVQLVIRQFLEVVELVIVSDLDICAIFNQIFLFDLPKVVDINAEK